jgi:CRP/FNR family cyclic AMP-dependent transcriptional regulator
MPEDFLALFSNATDIVSLSPGEVLFKKGEKGNHLYVVKSGEVTIGDGNHVFETLSTGDIFGEMALMDEEPRSATARAVTQTQVIPIDQRRFLFLVQQTPFFAIRVMRVMCARLRAMNERVTNLPLS